MSCLARAKRVPQTWFLNTFPGGYGLCMCDLHQHSGLAQMAFLHSLISRSDVMRSIMYHIAESHGTHMKKLTENGHMLQSDEPSS